MQRLTKEEYRNVLRDLTGGIVTNAGVYLPNEGGAGEGFNNVGEAQGMGTTQVEKYLEAARLTLRHLRATPTGGLIWNSFPMEPVDDPSEARLDAVNTIIEWFADEQYKYAFEIGTQWEKKYGNKHGPFLEAAWQFKHRKDDCTTLADIAKEYEPPLPIVPLDKWWNLLNMPNPKSPWVGWTRRWQALPEPGQLGNRSLRKRCQDIINGVGGEKMELQEDFAPDYEVSFSPKVLETARKDHIWNFRIEIGKAKELFLVCTQGGDDNEGDFGIWHSGSFEYADGSKKTWHQVTKIRGANSGRIYSWAKYNDGTGPLRADGHGVRPPGALKIEVPEKAKFLNVTFEVDRKRTERASLQVLILKEKPAGRLQSYYPGRLVFGGKKPSGRDNEDTEARDRNRTLRRINIPGANRTKAGLNAELNVMASWDRTPVEFIGGPWDHQETDVERPEAPYHMTAKQVLRNATQESLKKLEELFDRLESIAQVEHQKLHHLAVKAGWEKSREGVDPTNHIQLNPESEKQLELIQSEWTTS